MSRFRIGDKIRCLDDNDTFGCLHMGEVYEAGEAGRGLEDTLVIKRADGQAVGLTPGLPTWWLARRFERVETSKELPRCNNREVTGACPHRAPDSDLNILQTLLKKAGVNARVWNINEYVSKTGVPVKFEGIVLVHGAEEDGPYTEYIFDRAGNLIPDGVTSYYTRGLTHSEQA